MAEHASVFNSEIVLPGYFFFQVPLGFNRFDT
jgi:hypothetical protein